MIMTCFKYQEDTKQTKYNSIFPYIPASMTQLHLSFCKLKQ